MESIEFLGILAVGVIVAAWYFFNEEKGADGERGLLALKPDVHAPQAEKTRSRYRIKPRTAQQRQARGLAASADRDASPAYRKLTENERARRKFRRQDEARYRVKDKKTGDFDLRDPED